MTDDELTEALSRLLAVHRRSLATYLRQARPWTPSGSEPAMQLLDQIAHDQQWMSDRIAKQIFETELTPDIGGFPREFTSLHDLSINYLLGRLVENQRQTVAEIERCVALLGDAPDARALAEEALGMAQGHLELLQEQAANASAGT